MQLQCTTQAYVAFVKHEDRRMHKHVTQRWFNIYIVILLHQWEWAWEREIDGERLSEMDGERESARAREFVWLCAGVCECVRARAVLSPRPLNIMQSERIHTFPDPWPWINNFLEQWSERVYRFRWITRPFNWSGEKAWNNSVQQRRWTHSSKANQGSAHVSRYGSRKSSE